MLRLRLPMFDRRLGGLPRGSRCIFMTSPSIDPSTIGIHVAKAGLEEGYRTVYLVNNKPPVSVKRQARKARLSFESHEQRGRFILVDSYSKLSGLESSEAHVVDPYNLDSIRETLLSLSSENTLLVFDSVNSFLDAYGNEMEALISLLEATGDSTVIALFSSWFYDSEMIREVTNLFDGVFEVKPDPTLLVENELRVKKAAWVTSFEELAFPIKIISPGELRVYLPKVIVLGPYNAGKTTLIHALAEDAVSVERMGTTVALDHGSLDYKGFYMEFFGTPGQPQFDPIVDKMADGAVGAILVVDSADPSSFRRAVELAKKCESHGTPFVVAANKQDLESALPPKDVKEALGLGPSTPVVGCSAKNRVNISLVLDVLLNILSA
ncbi:MAG: GTP-binding protein [Candidatus Freyarchaeota archaeon]